MTNQERLLAIMTDHSPDRVPWIPRLEIWYTAHQRQGTLPGKFKGRSLREVERDLGIGTPARDGRIFYKELHDVEVRTLGKGYETLTEYITPLGKVSTVQRCSKELELAGIGSLQVEHMIRRPEDYPVVEYIIRHTEIIPTYEDYDAYAEWIGEDGVPMVHIGHDPMFQILCDLIGYNSAFFELHDHLGLVAHLLEVLNEQAEKIQQITLDSPARLILHGCHFDSQMTPPPLFEKYMVPYFKPFSQRLHERGKVLACHADADTSLLLHLIVEAGFDMAECFVTSPMVAVTLEQARAAFGKRVIIWGGLPSVMFSQPVSDEEFERYLHNVFRTIAPGDAFILGVADNVMPDAKLERIERVGEMVEEYGKYPVRIQ